MSTSLLSMEWRRMSFLMSQRAIDGFVCVFYFPCYSGCFTGFFFSPMHVFHILFFFFLNDPPPPEISPLPQHDPLPISGITMAQNPPHKYRRTKRQLTVQRRTNVDAKLCPNAVS